MYYDGDFDLIADVTGQATEEHPAGSPNPPDVDYLTMCVTVAKAVQD